MVKEQTKEHEEIKQISSQLNKVTKEHLKAKALLGEAGHELALLKAIYKHEKKTTTRPEQIYIENVKKRLKENIDILNSIYGKVLTKEKSVLI